MNEELFNMEVRKFLKRLGVTAQREIEKAVREAVREGRLAGDETLKARAEIRIAGVALALRIEGDIALA